MISIMVDEGYAYDYLSILWVKHMKFNNQASLKARRDCDVFLEKQVGEDKHLDILSSVEFGELIKANHETFDAVEKARYGEISAKEVDDLNMKRFYCKMALQNKFFPSSSMNEVKS